MIKINLCKNFCTGGENRAIGNGYKRCSLASAARGDWWLCSFHSDLCWYEILK